jgi:hypothetical protein
MSRPAPIVIGVLLSCMTGIPAASDPARADEKPGPVFRYDERTGTCVDSEGTKGLNPNGTRDLLRGKDVVAECFDFARSRSNLTYLRLNGANLRGSNFAGVPFYLGVFTGSDFRGANLDGTSGQVDYSRVDLRGASFLGANLSYNEFDGARLEGARFDEHTKLPFDRAEAEARGMQFVPSR